MLPMVVCAQQPCCQPALYPQHYAMHADCVHFQSKSGDLRASFKPDHGALYSRNRTLEDANMSNMYIISPHTATGTSRFEYVSRLVGTLGINPACLHSLSRPVCNIGMYTYSGKTHVTLSMLTPLVSTAANNMIPFLLMLELTLAFSQFFQMASSYVPGFAPPTIA